MSQFGEAVKENKGNQGNGIKYYYHFVNQYIKIPKNISEKVNTDYSTQNESVRYCVGIILTSFARYGVIAYNTRDEYYKENKGNHYTKTYFLRAVGLVLKDKYAFNVKGTRDSKFDEGISSILHPLEKIETIDKLYKVDETKEVDNTKFPLIEISKITKTKVKGKKGRTRTKKSKELTDIYTKWDLNKYLNKVNYNDISNTSINIPNSYLDESVVKISHFQPLIPYSHNEGLYAQSFQESQTLNRKYFRKVTLDFNRLTSLRSQPLHQVCLTRIFNGDNECGRWFQKGGLSYQQLSKKERPLILMNGQEVAELDYSAMHPHLLYAWEGYQCPEDFYQQIACKLNIDLNDDTKFVVKSVTLMSINAKDEKNLKKAINHESYKERKTNKKRFNEGRETKPVLNDELERLHLEYVQIVDAFRNAHPIILNYIYSDSSRKLMLDESMIMTSVLLELMKMKIPAIPIHDSVLFPKQDEDTVKKVKEVMLDQYNRYTGFTIKVK